MSMKKSFQNRRNTKLDDQDDSDHVIPFIGECDEPIHNSEEDALDLKSQIRGCAEFIKTCDTPMTISIEGDWGSGKTSFYNAIRDTISKDDPQNEKYIFVDFNAWQYSQFNRSDNLAIDLFYTIVAIIHERAKKNGNKEAVRYSKQMVDLFRGLGRLSQAVAVGMTTYLAKRSWLGIDFDSVYSSLKDSAKIKDDVEKIAKTKSTEPSGIEIIARLKNSFQKCIQSSLKIKTKKTDRNNFGKTCDSDKRIIIFVDDLDRLVPDKAVEMLEALKVFLDCKYCVFILAIDYNVVVNGVKMKYKDSINKDKGNDFFEKIIQVVYKVPTVVEHSDAYISTILRKHDIWSIITPDISALLRASGKDNPRAVKRLLNTFLLLRSVAKEKGRPAYVQENIKYPDPDTEAYLFAYLCLRVSNEPLYKEFLEHAIDFNELKTFLDKMNKLKSWLYILSPDDNLDFNIEKEAKEKLKTQKEEIEKIIAPLPSYLGLVGDDMICVKRRRFLLVFFKTLIADEGYGAMRTVQFAKIDISSDYYAERIRMALLLSDISGTDRKITTSDERVSYILIYKGITGTPMGIDSLQPDIITFPQQIGTISEACNISLENIFPLIDINNIDKYTFIHEELIDCRYENPIEVKYNRLLSISGKNEPMFEEKTYYIDSVSLNERLDQLNEMAEDIGIYVEWCRGRAMEEVCGFGDSTCKDDYKVVVSLVDDN